MNVEAMTDCSLQSAHLPTHLQEAGLGRGHGGSCCASGRLDAGYMANVLFSSSRKDQDHECPPRWRLKWAATNRVTTTRLSVCLSVCLFVPHVYVAAQPSPFNRFNKT